MEQVKRASSLRRALTAEARERPAPAPAPKRPDLEEPEDEGERATEWS
jgi:hypothetical protein